MFELDLERREIEFRKEKQKTQSKPKPQAQSSPTEPAAHSLFPFSRPAQPALPEPTHARPNPLRPSASASPASPARAAARSSAPRVVRPDPPVPPASDAASAPARPHRRLATDKAGPLVGAVQSPRASPLPLSDRATPLVSRLHPSPESARSPDRRVSLTAMAHLAAPSSSP